MVQALMDDDGGRVEKIMTLPCDQDFLDEWQMNQFKLN